MSSTPVPQPSDSSRNGVPVESFKSFLDHLEDLRWVIIKILVASILAMFGCLFFARELLEIILWPLKRVAEDPSVFLYSLEVTGGFTLSMKLALYAGSILACPFILYFIGQFLMPGLTLQEKRLIVPVFASGTSLFLVGVAMAYFVVVPAGLNFFLEYNQYLGIRSQWVIENYVAFVSHMCLAFGICFELPLIVLILGKMGIVTAEFLRQKRPYVIVLVFILAAIITPTTDPLNQSLLAVPMVVLYELCIWITRFLEKRKLREVQQTNR